MPEELDPALELELELDDVAAGAGDELDDFEDEPPPHPATAIAATTSASPNHFRVVSQLIVIFTSLTNIDGGGSGFLPVRRAESDQSATPRPQPPSMTISCPVMYSEAGAARNRASALMSSGRPTRCIGMSLDMAACTSG